MYKKWAPKIQSQKVSRKKAAQRLLYEKGARKTLMKLTLGPLFFAPVSEFVREIKG